MITPKLLFNRVIAIAIAIWVLVIAGVTIHLYMTMFGFADGVSKNIFHDLLLPIVLTPLICLFAITFGFFMPFLFFIPLYIMHSEGVDLTESWKPWIAQLAYIFALIAISWPWFWYAQQSRT